MIQPLQTKSSLAIPTNQVSNPENTAVQILAKDNSTVLSPVISLCQVELSASSLPGLSAITAFNKVKIHSYMDVPYHFHDNVIF